MMQWAEQEATEIDPTDYEPTEDDEATQISCELFNILTTSLVGEPLQMLHTRNFNGVEIWRRSAKRYSPTTSL